MKRKLWHHAEPDRDEKGWHEVELHATDAAHAINTDPEHWKTEKPDAEPEAEA